MRTPRKKTLNTGFYSGVILVDRRNSNREYDLLKSLGIKPGSFSTSAHGYLKAFLSREALVRLDPYWGKFYWSLHPV